MPRASRKPGSPTRACGSACAGVACLDVDTSGQARRCYRLNKKAPIEDVWKGASGEPGYQWHIWKKKDNVDPTAVATCEMHTGSTDSDTNVSTWGMFDATAAHDICKRYGGTVYGNPDKRTSPKCIVPVPGRMDKATPFYLVTKTGATEPDLNHVHTSGTGMVLLSNKWLKLFGEQYAYEERDSSKAVHTTSLDYNQTPPVMVGKDTGLPIPAAKETAVPVYVDTDKDTGLIFRKVNNTGEETFVGLFANCRPGSVCFGKQGQAVAMAQMGNQGNFAERQALIAKGCHPDDLENAISYSVGGAKPKRKTVVSTLGGGVHVNKLSQMVRDLNLCVQRNGAGSAAARGDRGLKKLYDDAVAGGQYLGWVDSPFYKTGKRRRFDASYCVFSNCAKPATSRRGIPCPNGVCTDEFCCETAGAVSVPADGDVVVAGRLGA